MTKKINSCYNSYMVNKRTFRIILMIFVVVISCVAVLTSCNLNKTEKTVVVLIENGDHFSIDNNYKEVVLGGSLTFCISLEEGYKFSATTLKKYNIVSDGDKYNLKLNNVKYPETIVIKTEPLAIFSYGIYGINSESSFTLVAKEYDYLSENEIVEGDSLSLTIDDPNFICWTSDESLANYGEYISSDTSINIKMDSSKIIYANYFESDLKYIKYYANGGNIIGTNIGYCYNVAQSRYHVRYNTINGDAYYKDGYSLVAWNTKADGTGERIGLGSRVTVNDNNIELYAIWDEWTDSDLFECEMVDDNLAITKYLGNSPKVTIPENINGKNVVLIKENAFLDKNMLVSIVLTKTILTIENNAFVNCVNLKSITFFDNLEEVSDASFGSSKFSTIYVNANLTPKGIQTYKIAACVDRVICSDKPNMIFQAGSSCAFGINSTLVSAFFDEEYTVTNFGWNAYRTMAFMMGITTHLIEDGDVYIHAGEPDFVAQYCDDTVFNEIYWGICEANYDMMSWVDMSIFENIFNAFTKFNKDRDLIIVDKYVANYDRDLDDYDETGYNGSYRPNTENGSNPFSITLTTSILTEKGFKIMNGYYNEMYLKGARVYESFGTMYKDIITNDFSYFEVFENVLKENLICPVISKIEDCVFDLYYMAYANMHHLSTDGAVIRTNIICEDIKAQMEKEAQDE